MLISNLISFQNVAARSRGRLQLATQLFRSNEAGFQNRLRNIQQSCWFCRRVWPVSSSRRAESNRSRKFGQNYVQVITSAHRYGLGGKKANYCAVGQNADSPDANAHRVTENIFTIPNALCVIRIGMTPFIANLIFQSQYAPAIGLITVAGITDLLDGWIARVFPSQSSVMGSFLDPLADKILVATLFLSLTYKELIPLPLTALIVGRDAILIGFGFYVRYISLDPPRTLKRYFNVAMPTAQLAPLLISKVNTGLQISVVGATLASTVISGVDLQPYLHMLWYTTAATTVISAVWYCFAKDTVKLLKQTSSKIKLRRKSKQQQQQ